MTPNENGGPFIDEINGQIRRDGLSVKLDVRDEPTNCLQQTERRITNRGRWVEQTFRPTFPGSQSNVRYPPVAENGGFWHAAPLRVESGPNRFYQGYDRSRLDSGTNLCPGWPGAEFR